MKKIELTQGKSAFVDDEDFASLSQHKWFAFLHHGNWYAARNITQDGRVVMIRMHREIMGCVKGDGTIVDHEDGNTLDNRKQNLRFATNTENTRNARPKNGKSYKGVHFDGRKKLAKPWEARICAGEKTQHKERYLGRFATAEEAALAYNEAARELHGEYARLNEVG